MLNNYKKFNILLDKNYIQEQLFYIKIHNQIDVKKNIINKYKMILKINI